MRSHLLRNLLIGALLILAAMHPATVNQLVEIAAGLVFATVTGIAEAATAQPEAALLTAGACYLAHQIRTHRPRTARARA